MNAKLLYKQNWKQAIRYSANESQLRKLARLSFRLSTYVYSCIFRQPVIKEADNSLLKQSGPPCSHRPNRKIAEIFTSFFHRKNKSHKAHEYISFTISWGLAPFWALQPLPRLFSLEGAQRWTAACSHKNTSCTVTLETVQGVGALFAATLMTLNAQA